MKVKVALKFRGREMAHTEFGFQVVQKFLAAIAAYAHPDYEPKLLGRGINVMFTPLPRNKRPKTPPRLKPEQRPPSLCRGSKTMVRVFPCQPSEPGSRSLKSPRRAALPITRSPSSK